MKIVLPNCLYMPKCQQIGKGIQFDWLYEIVNIIEMATDKNLHLAESLETHRMKHIQEKVDAFKAKADEVKTKLEDHYGVDVYYAFRSGSFAKHTAINIKFDIDLVVPFKHDSFKTLEDMYNDVHDFLVDEYKDGTTIRKQKVSLGLTFPVDNKGIVVKLDVVPGRELNQDEYPESNDLNLYFNEDHWGFKKGSRQKTNIQAQIDHIKGKDKERKLIRLLKIWKNNHHKDYKSFMLELFTIKAMENYTGEKSLWDSLRYVMGYIAQNITDDRFQLIDPGNSNNNVLEPMSAAERQGLANDMSLIIKNIELNSDNIAIYFPINKTYQESSKGYGSKSGETGPSYPPSGQRFGE